MPKAQRTNNLVQKQIKQLATRLMEISLLVDDYIYKKKPISQISAEAYIREISSYKDQCLQDARSLQVMEKLIRFMKGIIDEQQELQIVTENVYPSQGILASVPNGMISPVYSLVDEDMTELTQYLENYNTLPVELDRIENISANVKDQIVVVRYPNDNSRVETNVEGNQNELTNNNSDSEMIELCNDDMDEMLDQNIGLDVESEFNQDIQHAISSLSIRDIEAYTTPPFSQVCSQSILDDHPVYSTNYSRPKDVLVPLTQDFNKDIKSSSITQQNAATEIVMQEKIKKVALPRSNGQFSATKAMNHAKNETVVLKAETGMSFNDRTTKIKLPTTKQNIQIPVKRPVNKIKSQTEKNSTKQTQNDKIPNPRTKKTANNNKIKAKANTNKNFVDQSVNISKNAHIKPTGIHETVKASKAITPLPTKTQQSKSQSTIKNLTYHSSKNQIDRQNQNYTKNDKRKIPIYNTTVVEDLSWIENIRYVREILSDEYETLAVEDTFWEDYTLPCNLKEDDFNY